MKGEGALRTFRIIVIVILVYFFANASDYLLAQFTNSVDGWSFRNFKTSELGWDIYRDTFIGIGDSSTFNFDQIFYDEVYKILAVPGNCYGMSVMSLMIKKYGGFLGFCSPASQYSGVFLAPPYDGPSDSLLRQAINEVHGYQVSLPMILHMISVFAQGSSRDGNCAWEQVRSYNGQDDPAIVSITKSINPKEGGHTMIAYDAVTVDNQKRIMVWDPERIYANEKPEQRGWYDSGKNYIPIDGNGAWTFETYFNDTLSTWKGSPSDGGNIIVTPISIAGMRERNPSSQGLSIIGNILNTYILTGGDAQIEQVTDKEGRRLFKPGTFEIDTNPTSGMRTMIPWFPMGVAGTGHQQPRIYFSAGSGNTLKLRIKPRAGGYVLRIGGARSNVVINSSARTVDTITIKDIGHDEPTVRIERLTPNSRISIKATVMDEPGRRAHVFDATSITVSAETAVEFHVLLNHTTIEAISYKAPMKYNLQLSSLTRTGATVMPQESLNITGGQAVWSSLKDWTKMNRSDLVHKRMIIKR